MEISRIAILRDGGTIIINITNDPHPGVYRLPTPFLGEPRHIYRDGKELAISSPEEAEFLETMKHWWNDHITGELRTILDDFDMHPGQRHLTQPALDYLYIRTVINYLEKRDAA